MWGRYISSLCRATSVLPHRLMGGEGNGQSLGSISHATNMLDMLQCILQIYAALYADSATQKTKKTVGTLIKADG